MCGSTCTSTTIYSLDRSQLTPFPSKDAATASDPCVVEALGNDRYTYFRQSLARAIPFIVYTTFAVAWVDDQNHC